jgi:hypothetical protein
MSNFQGMSIGQVVKVHSFGSKYQSKSPERKSKKVSEPNPCSSNNSSLELGRSFLVPTLGDLQVFTWKFLGDWKLGLDIGH